MALNSSNDALMCRVFPSSLAPSAMTWFYRLKSGSIDTFDSLCTVFVAHYITSCKVKKDVDALFNITKGKDSLRTYVTKFKSEMLLIDSCDDQTAMVAFRKGMSSADPLYLAFARTPPTSITELFARAEKYSRQEDEVNRKTPYVKEVDKPRKFEEKPFQRFPSKRFKREEINEVSAHYPFNLSLGALYHKIKNEPFLEKANPLRGDPSNRNANKRCAYHNDTGHITDECRVLKARALDLARRGYLREFLVPGYQPERRNGPNTVPAQGRNAGRDQQLCLDQGGVDNRADAQVDHLTINTIHGGNSGDYPTKSTLRQMVKSAAHKREVNSISSNAEASKISLSKVNSLEFTDEDLIPVCLPHNDALVITVKVSNFTIRRAMVDTGSSVEILFMEAFDQMGIDKAELLASICPLVGFNGDMS